MEHNCRDSDPLQFSETVVNGKFRLWQTEISRFSGHVYIKIKENVGMCVVTRQRETVIKDGRSIDDLNRYGGRRQRPVDWMIRPNPGGLTPGSPTGRGG